MARVAVVTGGTRGIGEAISVALKEAGCDVAATYAGYDEKACAFTEATGIKTYKWNVADYEESKAGIAQVEADLGPIDIVVANAGITRDAPFHKMTPDQWKDVIDTNLTGVFNTVHPVWPGMRERKFGRVIVISSINGQKGQFAQVNYAATKAGDLGIVKSLAQEGARVVRVSRTLTSGTSSDGFQDLRCDLTDAARLVNGYLGRARAEAFWAALSRAPCLAAMDPAARRWMQLHTAIARVDAAAISDTAQSLLDAQADLPDGLRAYALAALMAGRIRQGRPREALRVYGMHRRKLAGAREWQPAFQLLLGNADRWAG